MSPTIDNRKDLQIAPEIRRYTYDEVVAELGESSQPSELWDGEIIMSPTPSFFHQEIVLRFYRSLFAWVDARELGKVITAPIDMVLSTHRAVQPDVAYISSARLEIIQRVIMGPSDLVAEVVSLGGRNRDRIEKKDLYEQYGVQEYWIIDPESQIVEVHFLKEDRYALVGRARAGDTVASLLLSGFEMTVSSLLGMVR